MATAAQRAPITDACAVSLGRSDRGRAGPSPPNRVAGRRTESVLTIGTPAYKRAAEKSLRATTVYAVLSGLSALHHQTV